MSEPKFENSSQHLSKDNQDRCRWFANQLCSNMTTSQFLQGRILYNHLRVAINGFRAMTRSSNHLTASKSALVEKQSLAVEFHPPFLIENSFRLIL
jgi:hypothetical protein